MIVAPPDDPTLARSVAARGLLDTGATITALSRDIVRRLDLVPEGKRVITNTHGQAISTQYRFRFGFLGDAAGDAFGVRGVARPFIIDDLILGIDLTPSPSFDVLVGMDVLSRIDVRLGRDRRYELSF